MTRAPAVALLLALSFAAFAETDPNVHEIPRSGVSVTKPAHWTFDTSKPGVIVARSPAEKGTFALSLLGMPTPPPNAAHLLLEQILLGVKAKLEDFQIVEPVRVTTIAGRHAAEVTTTYLYPQGESTIRIRSRMVLVPREDGIVMINMTTPPDTDETTIQELASILESLKIAK
jgi:hypothetical protein